MRLAGITASVVPLMVLLSGCLIIPTPQYNSGEARANLEKNSLAKVEPGVTNLEQVLLRFGEPDAVSLDQRKLAFRSQKVVGFFVVGGGYQATGGRLTKDKYLLVEFDSHDIVQSWTPSSRWLGSSQADAVMETKDWLQQSTEAMKNTCSIAGRAQWLPNAGGFEGGAQASLRSAVGYLGLTEQAIQFRDRTQTSDSAPGWVLPYETVSQCKSAKSAGLHRVVLQTRDKQVYSFSLPSHRRQNPSVVPRFSEGIQLVRAGKLLRILGHL